MKSLRNVAFASVLAAGTFGALTFSSCNKDTTCDVGYTGSDCKTLVSASLAGTYKGSGTDNTGQTYTSWSAVVTSNSSSALSITITLQNTAGQTQVTLPATLTSNTTFSIPSTAIQTDTYSGTGTFTNNSLNLSVTDIDNSTTPATTYVLTFPNMTKQ